MALETRSERHDRSDQPGNHHSSSEKLYAESAQLLGSGGGKRSHRTASGGAEDTRDKFEIAMPGLKGNDYTIKQGDTLSSVAARMLKLRGEAVSSRSVYEEVNRIIDLNSEKLPWLEKNAHKIRIGMKIAVWDRDTGPDPSCKWKDWKDAEPGRTTVAMRCESVFAGKDTQVVVTPGSRAVFTPNSFGFVAPKGFARVLAGAHVTAIGGDIIDDGGELKVLHADTRVRKDRPVLAKRDTASDGQEAASVAAVATATTAGEAHARAAETSAPTGEAHARAAETSAPTGEAHARGSETAAPATESSAFATEAQVLATAPVPDPLEAANNRYLQNLSDRLASHEDAAAYARRDLHEPPV